MAVTADMMVGPGGTARVGRRVSLENIRSFMYLNSSGRPLTRIIVMISIIIVPSGSKIAMKKSF